MASLLLEKDTKMVDCCSLPSMPGFIFTEWNHCQAGRWFPRRREWQGDRTTNCFLPLSVFLFFPRINTSSVTEPAWSTWGASTTMQRKRDEAHRRGLPPLSRRFGKRKKPSQPLFWAIESCLRTNKYFLTPSLPIRPPPAHPLLLACWSSLA